MLLGTSIRSGSCIEVPLRIVYDSSGRLNQSRVENDVVSGSEKVCRGARGDCLKGEYLGGGMGLLSLPFLAAAALREQCRR